MNTDSLGAALLLLRRRTGMLQTEAADRVRELTGARVTATRISNWENGKAFPSLRSLYAYLAGMDYNLSDLHEASLVAAGGETDAFAEFLAQGRRRFREEAGSDVGDFQQRAIEHLGGEALLKRLGELENRLASLEEHCFPAGS